MRRTTYECAFMRALKNWLYRAAVVGAVLAALFVLVRVIELYQAVTIPPKDITYTGVICLRRVMNEFVARRHRMPSGIDELAGFDPHVRTYRKDGWGTPLVVVFDPSGLVTISAPARPGRSQHVQPIGEWVWRFQLKDNSGRWIGTNSGCWDWISDPFRPRSKQ